MEMNRSASVLIVSIVSILGIVLISLQIKLPADPETGHFVSKDRSLLVNILPAQINKSKAECDGGCVTTLKFSDGRVPSIAIKDCISGELTNLGDLNGDGLDELGFLPDRFAGCRQDYRVFTYKNKKWEDAVAPFPANYDEFEAAGVKPVVKDPTKPGYVLVTFSVVEANRIVLKTKSIKI
jgi:hypothetical protein